ncbi:hypothetical protein GDO81_024038 [Engystomops pustulosus]|uniref:EF-hand domain-containing protein n=1 Tax=Engystomops pustulosus TaxID=76066 RepID=A0AAV6Z5M1_ENGPU|nr:hypothetical protein GDO81_024038 [Engystomops pustulosus]KAG8543679.1 hypothetical protein GDO81_024038 [Engystomops pustulosus]
MSKLIPAIQDIIGIFQKYSEKDCSHSKLNKDELNLLIQSEFADVIKNPKDPNTISSLLQILDENNDGEVDFNEFCDLLCKVLKSYYKVVYEKEDTCQQQDQPKRDIETTSHTTSQTSDEPPKFYQKQLYPKSQKAKSTYHDQKGASCEDQNTGAETTQTDPSRANTSGYHSSYKEPTIKIDETPYTSPTAQPDKDQTSHIDNTGSLSKDNNQGKDQTSHQDITSKDYGYGKDQTAKQDTTGSSSQDYGKDQTSRQDTKIMAKTKHLVKTPQGPHPKIMAKTKHLVKTQQGLHPKIMAKTKHLQSDLPS